MYKHEEYINDAQIKIERAQRLLEYSITFTNPIALQSLADDEFQGAIEMYKKAREVYPQYLMEFGLTI